MIFKINLSPILFCFLILGCDSEAEKEIQETKKTEAEKILEDPQAFLKEALNQALPGSMDRGYTTSMEPTEVSLVDEKTGHTLKLRIPKAYLTNKKNWEGGEQKKIYLQAVLPEMEPVGSIDLSKTDDPEIIKKRIEKNTNRVFIRLNSLETGHPLKEKFHSWNERNHVQQLELMHGLVHYKREQRCIDPDTTDDPRVTEENHCFDVGKEYFLTPEIIDENWVKYSCGRLEENPATGCSARVFYKSKALTYIFRRNQLYRWQEFDQAIRTLLDSFVIEE